MWYYYFNTRLASRTERKDFEEFLVTDGLSASLIVSRPKKANEGGHETDGAEESSGDA